MIINESPDGYAAMHVSGDTGNFAAGLIASATGGFNWPYLIVAGQLAACAILVLQLRNWR